MNIIGIEVLPGNPGLDIEVAPPEKLELTYDKRLRIATSFGYRGSAHDVTLYGSIGQRGVLGFDEIISSEAAYKLPESPVDFTEVKPTVDIPITADIAPGTDYDIYCKIKEHPEAGYPEVDDVITITGIPPTFELLEETIYPLAYVYNGNVEVSTFTFKSDPFTPDSWVMGKFAAAAKSEVKKAGGWLLEMRVYVDKTPLLWEDWRIEVISTPLLTTTAVALGNPLPLWAAILIAALAICLVIVTATWAIKTIVATFTRKPGLEDVKKTWSRETLISAINDFEEYLEQPVTPPEELEEKSDEELRQYCDELAKKVAPPVEGLGLALAVVAAGVLGLGALGLAGMAMAKRKELPKK